MFVAMLVLLRLIHAQVQALLRNPSPRCVFVMTLARRYVATHGGSVVTGRVKSVEFYKGIGEIFGAGEDVVNYKTDLGQLVTVSAPCDMKLLEVIREDDILDGGCIFQYEDMSQETPGREGNEGEPAKVVTTSTPGLQGREIGSPKVEDSVEAKATDVTLETTMVFTPKRAAKRLEAKARQAREALAAKAKDDLSYPRRCQYIVRKTHDETIQSIIDSGVDEEVRDLKNDFEESVEEFKGLKVNVTHMDAKGGMPSALKIVLTGPRELFSGVDGWFKKNITDFTCNEINMREVEQKYREIQKLKDGQATSAQLVSVLNEEMPEGRKRVLFSKLEDEQKEVFVKRGRGKKWEDAGKAVGRIYYYSVLFVFMCLWICRGFGSTWSCGQNRS